MLSLELRKKELVQSFYFFQKFIKVKGDIGYKHQSDLLTEFYCVFKDKNQSVIISEPDVDERAYDMLCIFENSNKAYICVTLKRTPEYIEIIGVKPADEKLKKWYDNKEQLRKERGLE